ncbi:pyridoxal phosphate-dependent aminotransferase [Variovorax sp. Root411]|uniref:pyridoxal phosphate-dependent aminotransferase n=1 Tax=Variovorax sp. Root411 TaxID=1736530 RepID=UPI0006F2D444|nr:pyridoxal phosphate-dependent aminotransferase [Variovorax sp. Root411]KQW57601.1 aspartate aminotransferase [Variovorax sp. Root411]
MDRFPNDDIISLVSSAPRHDLAESVGPNLWLGELLGSNLAEIGALQLGYGTAAGSAALRAQIAARHGVDADDVVVTVGGMHALFLLAFTLCGPGDEAVIAEPAFPLARNTLGAVGATVRSLPLNFDAGYRLDPEALRALLSPKTRIVSLASPQNPSGVAIPASTLREVAELIRTHAPGAWLIVDETYREAAYGDDSTLPSASALGPRIVTVASLSKCHGAAGLRIGWAIVRDAALRQSLVTAKFNTVISCSPLDEALAVTVLKQGEHIVGARRRHLAHNLATLQAWVGRHAARIEWMRPDAGALCCVRLKPQVYDDAALQRLQAALHERGVRLAPGPWFGDEPHVFRLGFGLATNAELAAALDCVGQALEWAAV